MANPEHVQVVRQGAEAIAAWRKAHPRVGLDLRRADLTRANLSGADLSGANLIGANLIGANLQFASLVEADLSAANLGRADLFMVNLAGANLSMADLAEANLYWANLAGANLVGARLTLTRLHNTTLDKAQCGHTVLGDTVIADCDLSVALGLETVVHVGPSSIGVDTLVRSFRGAGNQITPALQTFFLNAGVPQELLSALPGILAEVRYCTAFVCYGEPDKAFAERLAADLKDRGMTSCWVYALDATPGERTWQEIGQKRREADKMIVLCSHEALVRDGALKEIEEQIDEDPDKMVPVSLDNTWKARGFRVMRGERDLKPFLLDRNYADFANPATYQQALERLLKGLERHVEAP